jgi:hypothetical protein
MGMIVRFAFWLTIAFRPTALLTPASRAAIEGVSQRKQEGIRRMGGSSLPMILLLLDISRK